MNPAADGRRRAVAFTALGVAAFGALTLVTSGERIAPTLLSDGPSYVEMARHIRAHWFLPPPPLDLRPALYPTVIAIGGWLTGGEGLRAVRDLQVLLWLITGPLVTLWVYRVGGSLTIAAVTGCLHYTLGGVFFSLGLIYAETITVTLAVAAGLALTSSMLPGNHPGRWRWLAAGLAVATAHGRPIYQLLLPLQAAFAVAPRLRARPRALVRRAGPFVVAGLVGLLPLYVVNAVVKRSFSFVNGGGHSLANYLGDRRLLGKFPPEFKPIEDLYATRFAADPGKTQIGWWEVRKDWGRAFRARTGRDLHEGALDRDMGLTAFAVLSRNPDYYVRRWLETWWEFSTSTSPPVEGRWCPITVLHPLWAWFWVHLGAWVPFAILAAEVATLLWRGSGFVRLIPIATYLTIALANTAIEPWPGQDRYRVQVEIFLLIALGLVATPIAPWVRTAFRNRSALTGLRDLNPWASRSSGV